MSSVNMTQVSDPIAALVQAGKAGATSAGAGDAGQDRFLTMLITQLKNQDPLNPLDNAQLTSQLAQISTVQGIEKLNATLATLAGSFEAGQSLQAAALVGRQVLVAGNALELGADGGRGAFSLTQSVERLAVTVTDASGVAVHRVELGALSAGTHVFNWDGLADSGARAVDGRYTFSVEARAAGKAVTAETLSLGRIDAVNRANGGTILNLGALGEKPYADIKRIM
ncbi:MAG: flagellar hook assembly protein FlgD [Betaproteobacteria bacterium]